MTTVSLGRAYFEGLYARDADPWRFATSDYEREKYDATLAALPRARYACDSKSAAPSASLRVGSAARCNRLFATDIAEEPLPCGSPSLCRRAIGQIHPPQRRAPRMAGGDLRPHPSFGSRLP